MNISKRWMFILGIFVLVQVIFFAVDGTSFEPNINDSGSLFARTGRWILNLKPFTEWITPYSFPFFNLIMSLHVITILIQAVHDAISFFTKK
ncbi:YfzA family protein [Evansella sp. AB-P1]|nr:YfzA family protein [Evansella sp. AB-P1]MDG5786147.1 YfzA family protein [Evansella sp. AB-P1]